MLAPILAVLGILGAAAVLRGQESAGDIYVALIGHMDEQQQSRLRETRRRFPQVPYHKMTFLLETGRLPSFQGDRRVENEVLRAVARRLADRNVRVLVCGASCPLVPYRIAIREVNPRDDVGRMEGADLLLEVLLAGSIRSGRVYEDRIVCRLVPAAQGWRWWRRPASGTGTTSSSPTPCLRGPPLALDAPAFPAIFCVLGFSRDPGSGPPLSNTSGIRPSPPGSARAARRMHRNGQQTCQRSISWSAGAART